MQVVINGERQELEKPMTVEEMMQRFGFDKNVGAVAVNMTFVPSDKYGETVLKEGDEVEVLAPVCGG